MLHLGAASDRRGSRRTLLKVGAAGLLGGWDWTKQLAAQAQVGAAGGPAQAVIVLWLWGGPSHLDLFDPKPDAPLEYRGPYEPIATRASGLSLTELLPRMAQRADRLALVRSLVSGSQDHGVAGTIGLTGSMAGAVGLGGDVADGTQQPATGSIVARVRGFSAHTLPPYVILGSPLKQGHKNVIGEGAGVLGAMYDPFRLVYGLRSGAQLPHAELPPGMTEATIRERFALLREVDAHWRSPSFQPVAVRSPLETRERFYDLALSLLTSGGARAALAVEDEPDDVRRRFGQTRFGQSCLLARRLVERGIPYVQVNWSTHVEPYEDAGDGGWDMHDRNFPQLQERHSWIFDQAWSALIDDLSERGLLESTVVLAVGEFGRTPKINNKAGRDHWPNVYSGVLAGGGLRGGTVVGASDRLGEQPAQRPASPADLAGTLLAALGIGTTQLTAVGLTPQGQPLEELL